MQFEFDPEKSQKNKEKHGIDFIEAKLLWDDTNAIGFPARSDDEERFALLAKNKEKHWVAFYSLRKDRIRLISVRRARKGEKEVYES